MSRRCFQLSLKSLFLVTLVVAAFFAGYSLAMKQAERGQRQAEIEAQRVAAQRRPKVERYSVDFVSGLPWAVRQQATNAGPKDR